MKFDLNISNSILKRFLVINFVIFLILGIFTLLYLKAIKPNLVNDRSIRHVKIIENTLDHINRLNVQFDKESVTNFLLSTRFLFQNLDRVQIYDFNYNLLADTNTLDLVQDVFVKDKNVTEIPINESDLAVSTNDAKKNEKTINFDTKKYIKNYADKKEFGTPLIINETINNNFYVITLRSVNSLQSDGGYIVVSELANDILIAVEERKNFILRTVFLVALVIFIFSIFLNKYLLKPIRVLVQYTKAIREKDEKISKIEKFLIRRDEVGLLSRSLNEMTKDLYKRINVAERFSSDLAHEIRNPLTSLKGASEVLDNTHDPEKRKKLLKVISHDIQRIERLITDYSQMLKDEASLSREKMKKINLSNVLETVIEDFNSDLLNSNKNIKINFKQNNLNGSKLFVTGVESKLQQIVANLLDNAVSFSPSNGQINVLFSANGGEAKIIFKDQGPGFNETNINKVFDRFYSNRPENFGEHSGLGLNIVKNIIELHGGSIKVRNRQDEIKGAQVEVLLPIHNNLV